jgi:penicillin V acylase-like amidase (Ntn superfamily)
MTRSPPWTRIAASITALATLAVPPLPATACTIFVMTNAERTLFCNNEDWSNPNTRIWFVPRDGIRGCVYLGFDDDWAQGGMNTEGLAFDWVAGFKAQWTPEPMQVSVRGNSCQRMLETCSTVDEAIAFYRKHREASFAYGKLLVADRTGASVVIGPKDGKLSFDKIQTPRVLTIGHRVQLVEKMLNQTPELSNAAGILHAALQDGKHATKYSNVFDLRTGDIAIVPRPNEGEPIRLQLTDELKKGGHYYELPHLKDQLTASLKPLTKVMSTQ